METRLASPELGGNSEDLQRYYQKKVVNESCRLIESCRAHYDEYKGGEIIKIDQVDAELSSKNDWATMPILAISPPLDASRRALQLLISRHDSLT
ncbi:hypothetical protein C2G38_2232807 [Gigaspora rosea]|uniref:Uncharacterized protein n=1 Tax=Gigaspora rosea TaxID=44941 RepID=A0A397TV94_9GLOM|nr:hypothetical protein C2G38_2232807 [Gigaspora rosea]